MILSLKKIINKIKKIHFLAIFWLYYIFILKIKLNKMKNMFVKCCEEWLREQEHSFGTHIFCDHRKDAFLEI